MQRVVASSPGLIERAKAAITASPKLIPAEAVREFVERELSAPNSFLNRALQQNGYQRGSPQTPTQYTAGVPECVVKFFQTDMGQAAAAVLTPLSALGEALTNFVADGSENDDIKMGRRLQFSNESDLLSEDDEEEEEYCGKEKKIVSETMKKREILLNSVVFLGMQNGSASLSNAGICRTWSQAVRGKASSSSSQKSGSGSSEHFPTLRESYSTTTTTEKPRKVNISSSFSRKRLRATAAEIWNSRHNTAQIGEKQPTFSNTAITTIQNERSVEQTITKTGDGGGVSVGGGGGATCGSQSNVQIVDELPKRVSGSGAAGTRSWNINGNSNNYGGGSDREYQQKSIEIGHNNSHSCCCCHRRDGGAEKRDNQTATIQSVADSFNLVDKSCESSDAEFHSDNGRDTDNFDNSHNCRSNIHDANASPMKQSRQQLYMEYGDSVKRNAKERSGLFEKCPLEFTKTKPFKIRDSGEWQPTEIFEDRAGIRSLFTRNDECVLGSLPQDLQFEVKFAYMEYYFCICDCKFVPKSIWNEQIRMDSDEFRIVSFLNRSIAPRNNSDLTTDATGEDPSQDIVYNLGCDITSEIISMIKTLCESSYTQTKSQTGFDAKKDEVSWVSFLRSETFKYLVSLQSTVDYSHDDVRYVNTHCANNKVAADLQFLVDIADNGDRLDNSDDQKMAGADDNFDLLRDTRRLAHNLNRLRELARYEHSRHVSFAILATIRKFLTDLVQHERDRLRKILSFTQSESKLVFRALDSLTQSELEERSTLLSSHRNIRTVSNANHFIMMTKLVQRLASFYVNFTITVPGKSSYRVNQFLKNSFNRQDDLVKLRKEQYRDLLQAYGMNSSDLKWYTKVNGDSISGHQEIDLRTMGRKRKNHDVNSDSFIKDYMVKYSLLRAALPKHTTGNPSPPTRFKDEQVSSETVTDNAPDNVSDETLVVDEIVVDNNDEDAHSDRNSADLFRAAGSEITLRDSIVSSGYYSADRVDAERLDTPTPTPPVLHQRPENDSPRHVFGTTPYSENRLRGTIRRL
ncbi:unnamed protein product [Oikopleura dioica]|uniref:Uncharacterized protein n=1 Tax=Oikopleura dioica TaxID=34765 RepID=E4XHW3_OIKDI|nr:unnamed protein product [Oikopleura dioica]